MARLFSGSETKTNCQPCRLDPVGACSAISRHSRSSSRGTARRKSSRLRTARVVVRASSIESWAEVSSAAIPFRLEPVSQRVVALELVQGKLAARALGVLRHLDGFQQQLDLALREAHQPVGWPLRRRPVDQLGDGPVRLLHDVWTGGPEELFRSRQRYPLEL